MSDEKIKTATSSAGCKYVVGTLLVTFGKGTTVQDLTDFMDENQFKLLKFPPIRGVIGPFLIGVPEGQEEAVIASLVVTYKRSFITSITLQEVTTE